MKLAATRGPWIAQRTCSGWSIDHPIGQSNDAIGLVYAPKADIEDNDPLLRAWRDQSAANARLIAAAPDMFEALRKIAEEPITVAASAEAASAVGDLMELLRDIACPALAKARGENA